MYIICILSTFLDESMKLDRVRDTAKALDEDGTAFIQLRSEGAWSGPISRQGSLMLVHNAVEEQENEKDSGHKPQNLTYWVGRNGTLIFMA